MSAWHSKRTSEVLGELETSRDRGLTAQEAERRIGRCGKNELEGSKKEGLLKRFLGQMKDPMILVLLAAAVLSLWASDFQDWLDAVIILVIVVVNACISIAQENNAEKALEALRKMSAPLAKVIRDGALCRVETADLVPGDLIVLEAGDLVPADARILECSSLKADESAMTGESVPVTKAALEGLAEDTPLGDRRNMVISSTVITNGRARAVVTATGMDTEVGHIAGLIMGEKDVETPLQRKMAEISKVLSFACLCVCAVMFGIGMLQHKEMLDMFMTAVALAVAAIPEGLPAIVTIVLALGVSRMVRRNAIVKKLPAVETLGCASVICSDKTGTLTQNRMTVVDLWTAKKSDRALALTIGALCNDTTLTYQKGAGVTTGDPTETALVEAALKEGLDKNQMEQESPRRFELPFDSERKLMSTVHPRAGGGFRVCVKGAPDVLLRRCRRLSGGEALTSGRSRDIRQVNENMAERALRVLGVAYKDLEMLPKELTSETLEQNLTFVGLVGMIDPPRQEVKEAVAQCYAAGIRPVMITGDHKLTAVAIARELEIFRDGDLAITGEDLDFMPQELLEQEVEKYAVYARVSPEHKMRIVKAWQKRGKVVAMTGDGLLGGSLADEDKGGELAVLTGGVVRDETQQLLVGLLELGAVAQHLHVQVVGVYYHGDDARLLINFIADAGGILGDAHAHVGVFGDLVAVEPVQAGDLLAQNIIEGAMDAPQLVDGGAEGGPEDLAQAADVDGELHLHRQAHTGARRGLMDEAAEHLGPEAGLHLVLGHHPLLAHGDKLLAHGDDVAGLVVGEDVLVHQVDIALAHLDEMGLNGMAGPGFAHGLDGNALAFVRFEFHEKSLSFAVVLKSPSYYIHIEGGTQQKRSVYPNFGRAILL